MVVQNVEPINPVTSGAGALQSYIVDKRGTARNNVGGQASTSADGVIGLAQIWLVSVQHSGSFRLWHCARFLALLVVVIRIESYNNDSMLDFSFLIAIMCCMGAPCGHDHPEDLAKSNRNAQVCSKIMSILI